VSETPETPKKLHPSLVTDFQQQSHAPALEPCCIAKVVSPTRRFLPLRRFPSTHPGPTHPGFSYAIKTSRHHRTGIYAVRVVLGDEPATPEESRQRRCWGRYANAAVHLIANCNAPAAVLNAFTQHTPLCSAPRVLLGTLNARESCQRSIQGDKRCEPSAGTGGATFASTPYPIPQFNILETRS
jgi:hypothetical protein